MQKKIFSSVAFKIGIVIVAIEFVILAMLGIYYRNRFDAQIDAQVRARVELPGKLMSAGLLTHSAVANRKTMESLVGQSLVDAAVIGLNQRIFAALDPNILGKNITMIPELNPAWFQKEQIETILVAMEDAKKNYVISVTPLIGFGQKTPFLFAYIKINTDYAEAEKSAIAHLFLGGSILTIFLTSIAILALFEASIFRRIRAALHVLQLVEQGTLSARLTGRVSSDELGELYAGVNTTVARLEDIVNTLEHRVQERTAEIARKNYILDTFIENIPDRIYFKDCQGRLTRANQAYARHFGFASPEQMLGKTDFEWMPEAYARQTHAQEMAILESGEPLHNIEMRIGLSDGSDYWVLITKMPLRDERGEIIGTFGISRDITQLKLAQQQVEDAYVEIQKLNIQLKQENLRMSAELDIARRLQQMVLPMPQELTRVPGVEIVGYMQPAEEVGGDYYDVLHYHDNHFCIGIGDVTGHGLESGVLMLMTQTAVRTLIDRGETDPAIFLNTLNRVIYQNIQRMGVERNLTLALVNYQDRQLRLIGQHEEALVIRSDGQVERMDTVDLGFPLGLVEDIRQWISEATVTLDSGDGVVLYTDGVTEAQNAANKLYGLERLCAVISAHWHDASADAIKDAIIADVLAFVGGAQIYDDMTLVVLKQQ
ncbi:putative PAS/PAC sensor protein [Candidatus Moduliflexus flocculans]|uniref:Putative PAS/PAC sensor protein n=1 Tax=Candidatus Moduliflexus flocculans TaxID=1499966 RepID=A0A0S6VT17_9BACT|nr:putative PAS/PAC sensor protein [Candidatus Moduliflexus flocculans]